MSNCKELMEEIKSLLLSEKNKALAYSKLLHLQEISAVDSSSVQILADSSNSILASLVSDISDNDEEIAALALKCLGFMIYHPTVLASIGGMMHSESKLNSPEMTIFTNLSKFASIVVYS
ncbi:hypothetical protein ACJIZ3_020546 [Penstemon smallii]|uniref:Uncharacterized protein n=1 Tax=Penstemon smallii TaxID=265156 RepID=A0ABD3SJ48_9LAMI